MSESEGRPWEQPGEVRRDAEPHRGHLLYVLGTASVACGLLSIPLLVLSLVGLPLGVLVFVLARSDLNKMEEGLMDCRGIDETSQAERLAFWGVLVNLLAPLILPGCAVAAMILWAAFHPPGPIPD